MGTCNVAHPPCDNHWVATRYASKSNADLYERAANIVTRICQCMNVGAIKPALQFIVNFTVPIQSDIPDYKERCCSLVLVHGYNCGK